MDIELIAKYLSGNSSENEIEELLLWVEDSEENKKTFSEMKNSWTLANLSSAVEDETYQSRSYKAVINQISEKSINEKINRTTPPSGSFWKIAASIIVTIGLTAFLSYLLWTKPEPKMVYNQLVVPSGQQAQLTLSDGTKIWLNSKSKLTYPGTFEANLREVILDGEAYFQVSHNSKRPFIVKTSHLNVKVLGTSFNVTSYSDEDKISMALETGSISISEKGSGNVSTRLKPNDLAVYSKTKKKILLSKADPDIYKSWLKGQFKFHDVSFEEISRRLARNFNVSFVFKSDKIKQIRYNGSFYNYEALNQILKIMQTNSSFHYKIVKDKVYIE